MASIDPQTLSDYALQVNLAPRVESGRDFWADRRQTFPYRIMEGLPVIQAQSREASLIGCEGGHFYVWPLSRILAEAVEYTLPEVMNFPFAALITQ
jgi:hypothetical protein